MADYIAWLFIPIAIVVLILDIVERV